MNRALRYGTKESTSAGRSGPLIRVFRHAVLFSAVLLSTGCPEVGAVFELSLTLPAKTTVDSKTYDTVVVYASLYDSVSLDEPGGARDFSVQNSNNRQQFSLSDARVSDQVIAFENHDPEALDQSLAIEFCFYPTDDSSPSLEDPCESAGSNPSNRFSYLEIDKPFYREYYSSYVYDGLNVPENEPIPLDTSSPNWEVISRCCIEFEGCVSGNMESCLGCADNKTGFDEGRVPAC